MSRLNGVISVPHAITELGLLLGRLKLVRPEVLKLPPVDRPREEPPR